MPMSTAPMAMQPRVAVAGVATIAAADAVEARESVLGR